VGDECGQVWDFRAVWHCEASAVGSAERRSALDARRQPACPGRPGGGQVSGFDANAGYLTGWWDSPILPYFAPGQSGRKLAPPRYPPSAGRVFYSAPSRLIGNRLNVHLYDDRLAMVEVGALLDHGHPEVVDADLADYFGSILHSELLKSVALRPSAGPRRAIGPWSRVLPGSPRQCGSRVPDRRSTGSKGALVLEGSGKLPTSDDGSRPLYPRSPACVRSPRRAPVTDHQREPPLRQEPSVTMQTIGPEGPVQSCMRLVANPLNDIPN
jgi:hypothetical protein